MSQSEADLIAQAATDRLTPAVNATQLEQLSAMASAASLMELDIAELERTLKERKQQYRDLVEQRLPDHFNQLGLTGLRLANGQIMEVESFWTVSLSDGPKGREHKANAIALLNRTGNQALIKVGVSVQFGVDQAEIADDLFEKLRTSGYAAKRVDDVNTGSFKALLKELEEDGRLVDVDLSSVGAYKGRRAVIR